MTSDNPKTPRERLEARVTALLLGELSADEAAAMRDLIAHDPEFAKLHDRLQQAIALVRETVPAQVEVPAAPAEPLQLSEERRKKLLTHFMIPPLKPADLKPVRKVRFRLVEVLVVVAVTGILAALGIFTLSNLRRHGLASFVTSLPEASQVESSRAVAEFLAPNLSAGGGPTNVHSLKVVGYVNTVSPPESARAANTLLEFSPTATAKPSLSPAPSAPRSPQQIFLPAVTELATASKGNEVTLGKNLHWGLGERDGRGLNDAKTPTPDGYSLVADDPQWHGALEKPEPQRSDDAFVGRYAYIVPTPESADRRESEVSTGQSRESLRETRAYSLDAKREVDPPLSAGVPFVPTPTPPADNLPRGGALVAGTPPTASEEIALARRSKQPARQSGGVAGGGGTGGGGGLSSAGAPAVTPAAPGQAAAGEFFGGYVASPAPATIPAETAPTVPPPASVAIVADSDKDKVPVLGDLPLAGKYFRSEQLSSETRGRSLAVPSPTTSSLALGVEPLHDREGKEVPGALPVDSFGDVTLKGGALAMTPPDPSAATGRPLERDYAKTDGISRGERMPEQETVYSVDIAGRADTAARAANPVVVANGETAAKKPSSIVLPSVEQETAGVPTVKAAETASSGRTAVVPARTLRAGEFSIAGKPTATAPAPNDELRLAEGRRLSEQVSRRVDTESRQAITGTEILRKSTDGGASTVTVATSSPDGEAAAKAHAYQEAKVRLEDLQRFQTILNMKRASEKVDVAIPRSMMVEINDKAQPATAPSQNLWERISGAEGKYKSTARIKIERDSSDIEGLTKPRDVAGYDPYFVQTEFETIQSDKVLGKVVDQLKLNEVWAKQQGKEKLESKEAIAVLRKRVDLKAVPNTSLVEIRAKSDDSNEAAKLANAVAEVYHDYRLEKGRQLMAGGIKALQEQSGEQEKQIREARKEVEQLRQALEVEPDAVAPRKPPTNAPIPQPEIQTSENNFSTFSLNVSDVSFRLAAASLEKGQMPDPASVRSEEFINAFDYRDPEPAAGAPIAFAWERARYPFSHNRDLLRFSLKTAAAGRQAGRAMNIVLLLDNSGSMERADRVRIIREALRVLASQLQPQDRLSVITFSRTARLVADGVSGDKAGELTEAASGVTPQGGTNFEEGMNLAYATALRHYLAGGINRVVMLTDGAANLGDVEPESLKQKVEAQRKQGIALDCFGIGWEGFNDDLLEVLSRNGDGRYGFLNSPEEAATNFAGQLAGALKVAASDVKVQVEFNPRRVTSYRQIGYAKHQLKKEQFRDNTVDAAEIAAQEAGNALYTVEVNPAGEGPLCTVRVRFKIPGTMDYREHAWDVPFTGNALSLEQSTPAMRLAASASAFSEWLVASPFAAEVTPDRVLNVLSGVPEVFGADARPKKLEWMIRQAKSIEGK